MEGIICTGNYEMPLFVSTLIQHQVLVLINENSILANFLREGYRRLLKTILWGWPPNLIEHLISSHRHI